MFGDLDDVRKKKRARLHAHGSCCYALCLYMGHIFGKGGNKQQAGLVKHSALKERIKNPRIYRGLSRPY
jgi:hypothetical protein